MIPAQVIQRVFWIRVGDNAGSCFVLDVESKQYVCTAKHVLSGWDGKFIQLFHKGKWKPCAAKLVGFGSENADIAILALDMKLTPPPPLPLQATTEGIAYGQDAYFLGFPAAIHESFKIAEHTEVNRFFPIPFVKRAVVSAMPAAGSPSILFLDGHNNPGFSGGPVVFQRSGGDMVTGWHVAAVVTGYQCEPAPNVENKEAERGWANTGIVIAHDVKHALEAIQKNPVGFDLDSSYPSLSLMRLFLE